MDRIRCYYMVTLDGRLGGVVIECGGAFLTFVPRTGERPDTAEDRAELLAVGLDWLADQGFEVTIT